MPVLGPLLGFNDNVEHRGATYHVQTEDLGPRRKQVTTHLFADGGRIVHSTKTSYAHLPDEDGLPEAIRAWMTHQHRSTISALRRGEHDAAIGLTPLDGPPFGPPPSRGARASTIRSPEDGDSVPPPRASVPPVLVARAPSVPSVVVETADSVPPTEGVETLVPAAFPSVSPSVFVGLGSSFVAAGASTGGAGDSSAVAMSMALPLVRTAESSAAPPPSEPPLTLRRGGLTPDLDPASVEPGSRWVGFGERHRLGPALADLMAAYLDG